MGNDGPGNIQFVLSAADVVELRWLGYISKGTIGAKPDELDAFLGTASPRFALFDATGVTGFSADSREPGGNILSRLKKRGVSRTCVVTESGAIRMIGSAVALAVGLSIRFFETRALALEEIERMRLTPAPRAR